MKVERISDGEMAWLGELHDQVQRMRHVWKINPKADIFWHFPETHGCKIIAGRLAKRGLFERERDNWDGYWVYRITQAGMDAVAAAMADG